MVAGSASAGRRLVVSVSNRYHRDLVTRGVRATRIGEKALRTCVGQQTMHVLTRWACPCGNPSSERARRGRRLCPWPLIRESSAGARWKLSFGPQGSRKGGTLGGHPVSGSRRGGWGLHPVRRNPPSPARAGGAVSTMTDRGSTGSWLCSWAVRIAEIDEERRHPASSEAGLGARSRTATRDRWRALRDPAPLVLAEAQVEARQGTGA